MPRSGAFLCILLVSVACGLFQAPLHHEDIDRGSDWWRPYVGPERAQRIVEAQKEHERLDSLGLHSPFDVDYGFVISRDQFEKPGAAFALLLNTELFKSKLTGMVGARSSHYVAFNTLLERGDAVESFSNLLDRGYRPGQLYGLCGLYLTDRALFEKRIREFTAASDSVRVMRYDMIERRSVAAVATEISEGKWPQNLKRD